MFLFNEDHYSAGLTLIILDDSDTAKIRRIGDEKPTAWYLVVRIHSEQSTYHKVDLLNCVSFFHPATKSQEFVLSATMHKLYNVLGA